MSRGVSRVRPSGGRERGAAAVEFALILPVLLILLLGIIDFGLYYYNDLQLTHVARDAARYLSVGNTSKASAAISGANLVSTVIDSESIVPATSGQPSKIVLHGTYTFLTPLPYFVGIGSTAGIKASVEMRRE